MKKSLIKTHSIHFQEKTSRGMIDKSFDCPKEHLDWHLTQLKAIIGPDLIFDHNLDPETFTGKICGCAMVQSKELFGENKVLSGAFSNHDSLYSDYRYTREEYHEANPDKPPVPMIDLNCLYGFVTDNGYFLTRFQACQVGMRNNPQLAKPSIGRTIPIVHAPR